MFRSNFIKFQSFYKFSQNLEKSDICKLFMNQFNFLTTINSTVFNCTTECPFAPLPFVFTSISSQVKSKFAHQFFLPFQNSLYEQQILTRWFKRCRLTHHIICNNFSLTLITSWVESGIRDWWTTGHQESELLADPVQMSSNQPPSNNNGGE